MNNFGWSVAKMKSLFMGIFANHVLAANWLMFQPGVAVVFLIFWHINGKWKLSKWLRTIVNELWSTLLFFRCHYYLNSTWIKAHPVLVEWNFRSSPCTQHSSLSECYRLKFPPTCSAHKTSHSLGWSTDAARHLLNCANKSSDKKSSLSKKKEASQQMQFCAYFNAMFTGDFVLTQLQNCGDPIVGKLLCPHVESQQDISDCRVVTGI